MRKIICSLMAVAGILAFATVAQAACDGMYERLDMAQTDSTPTTPPPVKEENGG